MLGLRLILCWRHFVTSLPNGHPFTPIIPHQRCMLGRYGIPGYWHRNTLQNVPPSAFPSCPPVRRRLVRVSVPVNKACISTTVWMLPSIDHMAVEFLKLTIPELRSCPPTMRQRPTSGVPEAQPIPAHNALLNCQHTPFLYGIVAHVKHPQYFFRAVAKFPRGSVAPSASFTRPAVCLMVAHLFDTSLIRISFDFTLSRFDFAGLWCASW